jgi:hypothetical protein
MDRPVISVTSKLYRFSYFFIFIARKLNFVL